MLEKDNDNIKFMLEKKLLTLTHLLLFFKICIDRKGKLKVHCIINQDKASNYKMYKTKNEIKF